MSLRRRLLLALLGAVLAAGLVASGATYYSARVEAGRLLDEELREVALSLREHAVLDLSRLAVEGDFERRVVVQIWDRFGISSYLSNARTPLPLRRTPGFSTLTHEAREWRMFTLQAGEQTIQAAQSTAVRNERAAAAALRVLLPVILALPLLALLIWFILDRGFRPIERLARAVRLRGATALEPLPGAGVPQEIKPLVEALNNLLARLSDAFIAQRRFSADAAHELRTPLTALALQIQLVERARDEAQRAEAIARLKERAKRASRVVQQLLTMARLEPEAAAEPARAVSLDELATSVVDDLAPLAAQKGVALSLARAETVDVTGTEDALRLVAANLIDNAIRYTPAGGRIEVSVLRQDGKALLEVCDDGPGIPAHERERVFDRFYRGTHDDATGSGLGLAIVRQVAELHGGAVELAGGLGGRGLCARFRLPAAP
jgi:two-component system, OmpR family, sensor kinase